MKGDQIPALILAAGMGERLGEWTKSSPKSLISLDNKGHGTLAILIHQLLNLGTPEIYVVGGFCYEKIAAFLATFPQYNTSIHLIDARPDYVKGPIYSFLSASSSLKSLPLFFLFPADTLFHPGIFQFLVTEHWSENILHILLKSAPLPQIQSSWNILAPKMYPIICLPGLYFQTARREANKGKTKIIEAIRTHEITQQSIQFHTIPKEWAQSVDIDTEIDINQASQYIQKWKITF